MAGSVKELADYRLEKSKRNLELARTLLEEEMYSFALNRAYYSAFDAMRAINALDNFDSSKHSGVIAHFNQQHIKTGDFDTSFSSVIRRASRLRERSDYEDFFEPEKEEAERTIKEVGAFIEAVEQYLNNSEEVTEDYEEHVAESLKEADK